MWIPSSADPQFQYPRELLPHLRHWRRLTKRFVIEYAGRPIRSQERRAWQTARELAGLGPDVTPHVLRHTCATMLLQLGVSVYDVAGVLGTTEDIIGAHMAITRTITCVRL